MIDYIDYMSRLGTGLSAFRDLVGKSNKKMLSLNDERDALYADVQKFNEQAKALKKARRAEKLEKIKEGCSKIGKGLLKTGKFLSLCAYSLLKQLERVPKLLEKLLRH